MSNMLIIDSTAAVKPTKGTYRFVRTIGTSSEFLMPFKYSISDKIDVRQICSLDFLRGALNPDAKGLREFKKSKILLMDLFLQNFFTEFYSISYTSTKSLSGQGYFHLPIAYVSYS